MTDPPLTPSLAPVPDGDAAPTTTLTPEYVFREHAPRIYNIARRMLNNDADAEDVTQDVLLQVVRKLHTFRGDSALPTWLHRVTVNAALAVREKRANRAKHETPTGDENALDAMSVESSAPKLPRSARPEAIALAGEQRQLIDRAIGRLPELYRDVFVLADVEGMANEDIGQSLGLSVPAVKSRLHRARLRMRDALAPHFEEAMS